jgi:hypothetical protein
MGWMKSGSTHWAGHPSPSRLFPVTPWRKLDVRVQETLLCRYQLHRRCTLWRVSFGGTALLNLELRLMWIEFQKDIPLSVPMFAVKMLRPCVYPVVIVLRLSDFSVFGLRRLNVVPCIHHWKVVWCRTLFARRGWGGVVGVCFLVRWECFVETWSSS